MTKREVNNWIRENGKRQLTAEELHRLSFNCQRTFLTIKGFSVENLSFSEVETLYRKVLNELAVFQ